MKNHITTYTVPGKLHLTCKIQLGITSLVVCVFSPFLIPNDIRLTLFSIPVSPRTWCRVVCSVIWVSVSPYRLGLPQGHKVNFIPLLFPHSYLIHWFIINRRYSIFSSVFNLFHVRDCVENKTWMVYKRTFSCLLTTGGERPWGLVALDLILLSENKKGLWSQHTCNPFISWHGLAVHWLQ